MIIFFGPAGSGKSVQGQLLAAKQGWRWLSTGQLLRDTRDPILLQSMQQGKLIALLDTGTLFGELAFAEEQPSPRAATVVAATESTIGKWAYARLREASPALQSKMLQIFFRLATERLKQADERYLRLYRQVMPQSTDLN
jgi:CRP-like cAMP-binding protein